MESFKKPFKTSEKVGSSDGGPLCLARWEERSEVTTSDKIQKTKACIVEAHESTRKRLESTLPKDHEDHIADKRPMTHKNLVAIKILDAKAAVCKRMGEARKVASMALEQSEEQKRRSLKKHKERKKVHFAALMDIGHLQNAELEPKYQQYKGRVVLRGDIVKTTQELMPVSTEQSSSPSQMTAAQIMDVTARRPDCDGQAADAVSAYTHVKMEDAPRLPRIPKSECPDFWIRLPRHKWAQILVQYGRPSGSSRTKCARTSTCKPLVGRTVRRSSTANLDGKSTELEVSLASQKTRIILLRKRGWHQNSCKKAEKDSHVGEFDETGRSCRTSCIS